MRLDGRPITGVDPATVVRSGVSQVMEARRILAELTVEENLRAGSVSRPRRAFADDLTRVLDLFPRLAERRGSVAGYLSGGEQQMLAIGRALMAAPQVLLLDEPSLGLAPSVVEQVRDIIVEVNRAGTGVLLVEQNAAMALSIATAGYVLESGRVVREGDAAVLLADDDIREFYLGAPADAFVYGPVAERNPPRTTTIFGVDATKPTGLATERYHFTTPEAQGFEFVKSDI